MNKSLLILISMLVLLVTSCGVINKQKEGKSNFTSLEESMILEGLAEDPMRVFSINNRSDSLLLRKRSRTINFFKDSILLSAFVQRLHATVTDPKSMGVGIAAPQVGILARIIWVQRFDKEGFPWECIINPNIVTYSEKTQTCPEGCLSIPDKTAITNNRAYTITVEYQDIDGYQKKEEISAFTSVIFQHEIDHLDGILFIDHLENEKNK